MFKIKKLKSVDPFVGAMFMNESKSICWKIISYDNERYVRSNHGAIGIASYRLEQPSSFTYTRDEIIGFIKDERWFRLQEE